METVFFCNTAADIFFVEKTCFNTGYGYIYIYIYIYISTYIYIYTYNLKAHTVIMFVTTNLSNEYVIVRTG